MARRDEFVQHSRGTPFDNSSNGFTSAEAQSAIEELRTLILQSASPGFTWGRSGNVNANTWLLNDSVPSNTTGRQIGLSNAKLERIFISNELPNTFNLQIYQHDGTTYTLLYTVSMVAQRAASFSLASTPVTTGKEIALKLSTGSAKNLVVGLILSGSTL